MTALVWDQIGERIYQTGVDRGVLYPHDATAVPWNGLTNVEESSNQELKSYYLDGSKYLETLVPGDFVGKLSAFTYPDEFEVLGGLVHVAPGLDFHDQPHQSFDLSYRTKVGNDLAGIDFGYKIHILYNVLAKPEGHAFKTLSSDAISPIEFVWSLSGTPPKIGRYRPTVHVSIDSRETDPAILALIESQLYGTEVSEPSLPTIQELAEYFGYLGALIIVDHGDGTWSAIDESDSYITMLDATTFSIEDADTTVVDPDTYTISSTNVNNPL